MQGEIAAVRGFNRVYTRMIGVLDEYWLDSDFSLTEGRVLYEIASASEPSTASAIGARLGLDAGYLSRILTRFQKAGVITKQRSKQDGRESLLVLTGSGREKFAALDQAARERVQMMLEEISADGRTKLLRAMSTIEECLRATEARSFFLRTHQEGDMGWILDTNVLLYKQEYGWGTQFEQVVAKIVIDFIYNFDERYERCWIAERNGERIGCVMLIRHATLQGVAQLRLLAVDPSARGLGVGRRLANECTRFAAQKGYKKIVLWTHSVLTSARKIYEREGYQLVSEEKHSQFGPELVGQMWELDLSRGSGIR